MAKKKSRARTERRVVARGAVKLAEARLALARLEPGGTAERAIVVASASVIEPQAGSMPCAACGQVARIDEHVAENALRVVRVRCTQCGVRRDVYFRIAQPS